MRSFREGILVSLFTIIVVVLRCGALAADEAGEAKEIVSRVRLTFYWVEQEADHPGERTARLFKTNGKPLARVSPEFATEVKKEGTGLLEDGRMVNLGEKCRTSSSDKCFFTVDRKKAPYGWGSYRPLTPYQTIAVTKGRMKDGEIVYIKEFDGLLLPGAGDGEGPVYHDGCFRVDDSGDSLGSHHVDVFVYLKKHYRTIHRQMNEVDHVTLVQNSSRCRSFPAR